MGGIGVRVEGVTRGRRRRGDKGMGRQGERETRGRGDKERGGERESGILKNGVSVY
jgi:hypothetical protein